MAGGNDGIGIFQWAVGVFTALIVAWVGFLQRRIYGLQCSEHSERMRGIEVMNENLTQRLDRIEDKLDRLILNNPYSKL